MALAPDETYRDPKKCGDMVLRHHREAKETIFQQRTVLWPRWLMHYYRVHDPLQYGVSAAEFNMANMTFLPFAKQQVDVMSAQIAQSLRDVDPIVRLKPEVMDSDLTDTDPDLDFFCEIQQEYLNQQVVRDMGYRREIGSWAKAGCIYGTVWLFLEWAFDFGPEYGMVDDPEHADRTIWKRTPKDPEKKPIGNIRVCYHNNWDVLPDPWARGMNPKTTTFPARYVQRILFIPIDKVLQFIENNPAKNWVVKKLAADENKTVKEYLEAYMGFIDSSDKIRENVLVKVGRASQADQENTTGYEENKRVLKLLDHWEPDYHVLMVIQSENMGSVLMVDGPDSHPCRNVGIPFRQIRIGQMPDELWGEGIVSPISDLNHTANVWWNLRQMHLAKLAGNIILLNTHSGIDASDLDNNIGRAIPVRGHVDLEKVLKMISFPDTTNMLVGEIDWLDQQIKATAGATDQTMGMLNSKVEQSVRGMAHASESQGIRKGEYVACCQEDLAEVASAMILMNQRYVNSERAFAITGKEGVTRIGSIGPDLFRRGYQPIVDASPIVTDKGLQHQQLINTFQLFSAQPSFDQEEGMMAIIKSQGLPNPQRFIRKFVESPDNPDAENDFFMKTGGAQIPPVYQWQNHPSHISCHDRFTRRHGTTPVMDAHKYQHQAAMGWVTPPQPNQPGAGGPPQGVASPEQPPIPGYEGVQGNPAGPVPMEPPGQPPQQAQMPAPIAGGQGRA